MLAKIILHFGAHRLIDSPPPPHRIFSVGNFRGNFGWPQASDNSQEDISKREQMIIWVGNKPDNLTGRGNCNRGIDTKWRNPALSLMCTALAGGDLARRGRRSHCVLAPRLPLRGASGPRPAVPSGDCFAHTSQGGKGQPHSVIDQCLCWRLNSGGGGRSPAASKESACGPMGQWLATMNDLPKM